MTKEEAYELLNNKKVYVNGKSLDIQDKLFSLGFKWSSVGDTKSRCVDSPFLFIHCDKHFSHSNNMIFFKNHQYEEISVDNILNINIDPFTVGDILSLKEKNILIIYGGCNEAGEVKYYVYANEDYILLEDTPTGRFGHVNDFKLANDSEIYQMINILEERGKKWNNDLKCLEDIKVTFKPFDQVLVRDKNDDRWIPAHFKGYSKGNEFPYGVIPNMFYYKQCIPFKGNEHLCGTSNK